MTVPLLHLATHQQHVPVDQCMNEVWLLISLAMELVSPTIQILVIFGLLHTPINTDLKTFQANLGTGQ
mgnify:CR=1 FL=1